MDFGLNYSGLKMCSTCLLLMTTMTVCMEIGSAQQKNDLTSTSECYNYEISFGGIYLRKFYTCCEIPTTTGTQSPCQEPDPIANFQCVKKSRFEHQNVSKEFNCKGQTGQKNARQRCTSRWGWLEQEEDEPGCWAFSECFAGACEKEEENTGSSLKIDFCGDGRCDYATEDSDSCPIDCCPTDNPDVCQVVNNTCPDACCGQPLCCRLPPGFGSFSAITNYFVWVIIGVVGFIVLLNVCLCCCCCCLCCRGKKGRKRRRVRQYSTRTIAPLL